MSSRLPLELFDYDAPEELIASVPAEPRDSARLLVVRRDSGAVEHRVFRELTEYLGPGDCLVLNRTRVLPCRLLGRKETGGKAELLLVAELEPGLWSALGSGLKRGVRLLFDGGLEARVEGTTDEGEYLCRFSPPEVRPYLAARGLPPLPPYIAKRRPPRAEDRERYQTVFAREPGSIAAPTAGLHFTERLLGELAGRGVAVAELTLHVGRGTFRPITAADADAHEMLPEWYRLEPAEAAKVSAAGRVIAVGTTVTRALETLAARPEGFGPGEGWSSLYIRPGHRWRALGGLITNFHLPRSTPLLLAAAFVGRERLLAAYRAAVERRYRLYSFGDAMLAI